MKDLLYRLPLFKSVCPFTVKDLLYRRPLYKSMFVPSLWRICFIDFHCSSLCLSLRCEGFALWTFTVQVYVCPFAVKDLLYRLPLFKSMFVPLLWRICFMDFHCTSLCLSLCCEGFALWTSTFFLACLGLVEQVSEFNALSSNIINVPGSRCHYFIGSPSLAVAVVINKQS